MSRVGGTDGPEDVDATFAEIVSDLRAQGVGEVDVDEMHTNGPDRGRADADKSGEARGRDAAGASAPESATSWRDNESEWEEVLFGEDPADDEEHYIPPEPPPLPRPRRGAFVVLLFFVLGLLLLIAPTLLGLSGAVGLPLGMLSLATGIGLLLLRVKQGPPEGSDPDNGAQV